MTTIPKSRSFRFAFSLRTLFALTTAFALWLGWNVHQVQKRDPLLHVVAARGAWSWTDHFNKPNEVRDQAELFRRKMPILWPLLGAQPVGNILLPNREFSEGEVTEIRALFPEADVSVAQKGMGMGMM